MYRGGFPGGGNMNNLLKQAQKLQADMEKTQEELGNKILEASSGGGAVKVTATGKKEIKSKDENPEDVKFGKYEINIADYKDKLANDSDDATVQRVISSLQSTANKINQKIAILSHPFN